MKRIIIVPATETDRFPGMEILARGGSVVALVGATFEARTRSAFDSEDSFFYSVGYGQADLYTFHTPEEAACFAKDKLEYKRQSKNRPQNVARAVFCGGVKVVHRRILIPPGVAVQAASVEHRRDVFRGDLWARTASGIGGWAQSTSGGS
jgi:hypothetical protein